MSETKQTTKRKICEIANEIARLWRHVHFSAVPYLDAMKKINSIDDMYGSDSAHMIVLYFLSNATHWRGPDARRLKDELKSHLPTSKAGRKNRHQ